MAEFNEEAFLEAMENGTVDETTTPTQEVETVVDTLVTPAVEDPATSTETTTQLPEPKTIEVIKEVEKVVEKWPEFKNEESEKLYKAWLSGDEGKSAIRAYIKETEKDYTTMSDLDVRREALKKEHPNWSKQDVELTIRSTYGDDLEKIDISTINKEDNPVEYAEALQHNKEVDKNTLLLAVHARDDRYNLIEQQSKIELPQIKQQETIVQAPTVPTAEDIAVANEKWVKSVDDNMPNLQNIKLSIDGKEVEYAFTDDDKKKIGDDMKLFNIFDSAKKWGWYNEDGTPNILKIAEDVQWIENKAKISTSIATQIKTDTTKGVIGKIKNLDDGSRPSQTQPVASLEEAYYATFEGQ